MKSLKEKRSISVLPPQTIKIETKRFASWIIWFCLGITFVLVMLDIVFSCTTWIPGMELKKIFSMTRERAVGTWFSTVLAFLVGCTGLSILLAVRMNKGAKREIIGWLILSLFFIYMSIDDCAYIHERSGDFLKRMISSDALPFGLSRIVGRFPSYYWQLIMGPFFAAMALFMLYFLWQRFRVHGLRKNLVLSISGLACAVLLDFTEGMDRVVRKIQAATGVSEKTVVHMLRLTEESLEILAMIFLLYTFLKYLSLLLQSKTIIVK